MQTRSAKRAADAADAAHTPKHAGGPAMPADGKDTSESTKIIIFLAIFAVALACVAFVFVNFPPMREFVYSSLQHIAIQPNFVLQRFSMCCLSKHIIVYFFHSIRDHKNRLRLPKSIDDVKELGEIFSTYKEDYFYTVMLGFSLVYILYVSANRTLTFIRLLGCSSTLYQLANILHSRLHFFKLLGWNSVRSSCRHSTRLLRTSLKDTTLSNTWLIPYLS